MRPSAPDWLSRVEALDVGQTLHHFLAQKAHLKLFCCSKPEQGEFDPLLPPLLPALWVTGGCLPGGVVGWIHQPLRVVSVWVAQPHALGVCAVRAVGESKTCK